MPVFVLLVLVDFASAVLVLEPALEPVLVLVLEPVPVVAAVGPVAYRRRPPRLGHSIRPLRQEAHGCHARFP